MTWTEASNILTVVVVPVGLATALCYAIAHLVVITARRRHRRERQPEGSAALLFAFAALGVSVGFSTAYSRTPALGAVLPALITLMSGTLTYSVTKEGLAQFRSVLPYCISLLSIASLVGLSIGGTVRGRFDDYERQVAQAQLRFERVVLEGEKAKYLVDLEIFKQEKLAQLGLKSVSQPAPSRDASPAGTKER